MRTRSRSLDNTCENHRISHATRMENTTGNISSIGSLDENACMISEFDDPLPKAKFTRGNGPMMTYIMIADHN